LREKSLSVLVVDTPNEFFHPLEDQAVLLEKLVRDRLDVKRRVVALLNLER
jgi:hypothetical protein